jgi:hypothetical protein
MQVRMTLVSKEAAGVSRVKVRIEGHYEVEDSPYGKDYVWSPAHGLIECDCGRVMDADEHHTTCPSCGADHSALMREVVGRHLSEEVLHPWHADYEEWLSYKKNRAEYQEWLEEKGLDREQR